MTKNYYGYLQQRTIFSVWDIWKCKQQLLVPQYPPFVDIDEDVLWKPADRQIIKKRNLSQLKSFSRGE